MPEYALPVSEYQPSVPEADYVPTKENAISIRPIQDRPEPIVEQPKLEPIIDKTDNKYVAVNHDPWEASRNAISEMLMQGVEDKTGASESKIIKKLFGLGGEERYQLWPEKMVRSGITAAGDALAGKIPQLEVDPDTGDVHTSPQMIERSLDMSALAGTGGLAGADATLGSGPMLRPALKYSDKIYKAPVNGQHLDALPKHLAEDFHQKAMNGEDINHYQFGFMNHKGQFLNREAALDYAIKEGMLDPHAGKYGALTSTLLADSSKPGTAIEAMAKTNAPTFYSAVEHQVNQIAQSKMTGDQWLGTLANKPGVKSEELQWTGLSDFLKENGNKSISKEQVQEHLQNNKVELKEVRKGDNGIPPDEALKAIAKGEAIYFKSPKNPQEARGPIDAEDVAAMRNEPGFTFHTADTGRATKYHSYQLPGGENYREMLLTLPGRKMIETPNGAQFSPEEMANPVVRRTVEKIGARPVEEVTYKSSHWDEPNILAHVRMNDRNIDGKKSLHLEEIQSDWHQQGRDKGYKSEQKPFPGNFDSYATEKGLTKEQRQAAWQDTSNPIYKEWDKKMKDYSDSSKSNILDAPFKKSWHELALKRMIREAAEKGYDRLSWTPGEAQAARYDLSKQIDTLKATPVQDQHGLKYEIHAVGKGTTNPIHRVATEAELPNIVGKEMAKKIVDQTEGKHSKTFTGIDLKIGGEGMKGFYDQIIPKALEKIGKEYGVKVKQDFISDNSKAMRAGPNDWRIVGPDGKGLKKPNGEPLSFNNEAEAKASIKGQPVNYIDIPQSLKDAALHKGFALFAKGVPFPLVPVEHDPWSDKNASQKK